MKEYKEYIAKIKGDKLARKDILTIDDDTEMEVCEEIVRCKDCIFAEEPLEREHDPEAPLFCDNKDGIGNYVGDLDYCSEGRKSWDE